MILYAYSYIPNYLTLSSTILWVFVEN